MPIQTFADSFRPASLAGLRQDIGSGADPRFGGFNLPGGGGSSSDQQVRTAQQQVQHFKLWNYIAVDRNAMTVARSMPCVGVITSNGGSKGGGQRYSMGQKRFAKSHYGSVLQSGPEDFEPVDATHPLKVLLENINETDWWVSFCYETMMFWQLTGSFYWWVIPNGVGTPVELYNIPPQWVTPKYAADGTILMFEVRGNGRMIPIPPSEIIYAHKKSPFSKQNPLSPVSAGAEWVLNSERIEEVRKESLAQGIYPTALVELDATMHNVVDDELIDMIGEKLIARHGGSGNGGKPLIQVPGMKITPWGRTADEVGVSPGGDAMRDAVLALHGTPRAIAGISADLNRASIEGAQLIYAEHTIIPLQVWLSGVLTWKLAVPRFGQNLRVWFEDCRPGNAEQEIKETELDAKLGAISPNERRSERGRAPLESENADKTFVPSTFVLLDKAGEKVPDPKKDTTNSDGEAQRFHPCDVFPYAGGD